MPGRSPDSSTDEDGPSGFDAAWAEQYSRRYADRENARDVIDFLLKRGGESGTYLDLCAGVGRIGIPLASRGVHVTGVDNAPAMLKVMAEQGASLPVETVLEDCAAFRLDREFSLAYVTFNSLFQLDSNAAQQAMLNRVAAHLLPGGTFVVEAFVPRPPAASTLTGPETTHLTGSRVEFTSRKWEVPEQVLWVQRMIVEEPGDVRLRSLRFQYLFPPQLDAMARRAGLELEAEYADWTEGPLREDSDNRIAVYRRTDENTRS
ncbi:class I SAM-dependent methyltransferase [Streptomyces sp. NPDC054796]